ncbi:hypothetical protein CXB51_015531 [Gossypium anomalum]|uniref:Uncharacterized protein n=1 Tax=Gossypium anomalum TaxID=47600 RepID=A0A8J5YPC7_9ROSI|nr:hypothetical protein CXB51_015531 [Gossypium anomalum]
MSEEEWVKEALTDSMLAAKVLLSLYQASSPPPRARQRRSKQSLKKKSEPARASPTTPLSWSGGISISGGGSADRSEESSRPPLKPIDNARSKDFNVILPFFPGHRTGFHLQTALTEMPF